MWGWGKGGECSGGFEGAESCGACWGGAVESGWPMSESSGVVIGLKARLWRGIGEVSEVWGWGKWLSKGSDVDEFEGMERGE